MNKEFNCNRIRVALNGIIPAALGGGSGYGVVKNKAKRKIVNDSVAMRAAVSSKNTAQIIDNVINLVALQEKLIFMKMMKG